jgi:hypothetical protein
MGIQLTCGVLLVAVVGWLVWQQGTLAAFDSAESRTYLPLVQSGNVDVCDVTPTPIASPTLTATPAASSTPTVTASATPAVSPTPTVTATSTPSPTCTPTPQPTPTDAPMVLHLFNGAAARQALCNDGSPAGYYVRRSANPDSREWVVHLQGGGGCYSLATCDERGLGNRLTSSDNWPDVWVESGIFSQSPELNPDFYDFNHVYVPYCSSDYWAGNRVASPATANWAFFGRNIFDAAITDLSNPAVTDAPTLAEADTLLLSGGSAGGLGVFHHLDRLSDALPAVAVVGISDGGYVIDMPPYDPLLESPAGVAEKAYNFLNARTDASCMAANPTVPWMCGLGPTVYPHIATPLLVQIDQQDYAQLARLGITDPTDPAQMAYIAQFRAEMVSSLAPVEVLFAPNANVHVLLKNDDFWDVTIDGYTLRDVVNHWLFGTIGPVRLVE